MTAVSDTLLVFPNPALRSPPKPLCERFNRSPMTSPEKMAASFKNAERLRAAHLDGVVEKAAREGRAVENVRLNLEMRLADARDKLERRLDADSTRVSARKDEKQAKMQQAKDKVRVPPYPPPCDADEGVGARRGRPSLASAPFDLRPSPACPQPRPSLTRVVCSRSCSQREALAAAVAKTREAQKTAKEVRSAELLAAANTATERRERALQSLVDKSASAFRKAIAVAASVKEQERMATEAAGTALTIRLEAAEERRNEALNKSPTKIGPPSPSDVRHRVLNDAKVESGLKQRRFEEAMQKASSKREAQIEQRKARASESNAHAASVAAEAKAAANGTAAKLEEARHSMYWKMVSADVKKRSLLRQRQSASHIHRPAADTTAFLLVVPMGTASARTAPPALHRRLMTQPRTLVASAPSRQAGAAARRQLIALGVQRAAAQRVARVAAARARRDAVIEATRGRLWRRDELSRSAITSRDAIRQGKVRKAKAKASSAVARRAAVSALLASDAAAAQARCSLAASRRASVLQCIAKVGLSTSRVQAAQARRQDALNAQLAKAVANEARCAGAEKSRELFLEARVATAQRFLPEKLKTPSGATDKKAWLRPRPIMGPVWARAEGLVGPNAMAAVAVGAVAAAAATIATTLGAA